MYMNNFLKTKTINGIKYYILEKDTPIYRGDSTFNIDNGLEQKSTFFGFTPTDVEKYGIVYQFETAIDISLVAIDAQDNDVLINSMPPHIQTIMMQNYGYKTKIRDSVEKPDKTLVKYLCDNGYNGYAINEMDNADKGRGDFHKEMAICDMNKIKKGRETIVRVTGDDNIEALQREDQLMKMSQQLKDSRKSKRQYTKDNDNAMESISKISKISNKLFDDESDEDDDDDDDDANSNNMAISRKLFGGKKLQLKKKTQKRSTRKWKQMKPSSKRLKSYKRKFGASCFLLPKQMKYPICNKKDGKVECKGLLAAHNRAMLSVRRKLKPKTYSYKKMAKKARNVAKGYNCKWSRRKRR